MAKTMVGLAMAIGVGVLLESFISAPDVDSESGAPFAAAGLQATVSTSTPAKGSMDIPLDILEVPAVSRVEQDVAAKRVTPSAAKSNPTTTIASSRSEGGIAEELKILVRAHTALRGRRPDEALAALDEHESRFPNGALSEERASQRVFALCAAGRTSEARSAAERFLAVYPKSPMAARVRSSCAGDGPFSHGQ